VEHKAGSSELKDGFSNCLPLKATSISVPAEGSGSPLMYRREEAGTVRSLTERDTHSHHAEVCDIWITLVSERMMGETRMNRRLIKKRPK